MDIISLIIEYAIKSKYVFLFLLNTFDGTVSNFVFSVIASTGFLNIWLVLLLAVIAEIMGDMFCYITGRYLPKGYIDKKIEKYQKNGLLAELGKAIKQHPFLSIAIVKIAPFISMPCLIYIGRSGYVSFWKYLYFTLVVCITQNCIVSYIGYNTGMQLEEFLIYYNLFLIISILLLVGIIIFILMKVYRKNIEDFFLRLVKKLG